MVHYNCKPYRRRDTGQDKRFEPHSSGPGQSTRAREDVSSQSPTSEVIVSTAPLPPAGALVVPSSSSASDKQLEACR
ncbi:Os06g0347200 [Oryza sativa Japonica Group]|uniref:Os06g0347200 protein n=1 Tax=Oryza sativa subsp. japonica TaxID=39947 RepID=A0A0P0WWB4_ORYSJ|nr:Os06g0347200 [Oryza sativa Japonica Group]